MKFFSGSRVFLDWMWENLRVLDAVEGGTIYTFKRPFRQLFALTFAKADSKQLLDAVYKVRGCPHLARQRAKYEEFLRLTARALEK